MSNLVTGSSGLLGGCLLERLRSRGATARGLDLVAPEGDAAAGLAEFVQGDASEPGVLDQATRDVEVVYHLAAAQRMKPQFDGWTEEEIFERNLGSVRLLLEAAERNGVRRIVFVSSSGVYGLPRAVPVGEGHETVPLGAYGRSKLRAEAICREAASRGLEVAILRPMSLFGPGMSGIFPMLFEWVRNAKPVYVLGSGRNRVQMSSAWDVAEACLLAGERPESVGRTYNVASDPATVPTVYGQVRALVEHAGSGSPIVCIPASLLRNAARLLNVFGWSPIVPEHYILADRDFITDVSAARTELGWQPRFDNVQMTLSAYDDYLAAGPSAWQPIHPLVHVLNALLPHRLLASDRGSEAGDARIEAERSSK